MDKIAENGVLLPVDIVDAFDHLFLLGLASIVQSEKNIPVGIRWQTRSTALVFSPEANLDEFLLTAAVKAHVQRHVHSEWLNSTAKLAGGHRSPLSPRIGKLSGAEAFEALERARRLLIDGLDVTDILTQRFLGSLGRPADWTRNSKGEMVPDWGASAWEMKTRNRGEEFVQNRLAKIAQAVDGWDDKTVLDGLCGYEMTDTAGRDSLDSRTPTGLRSPGPADNARAWCALWGIANFPIRPVSSQSSSRSTSRQISVTAGAVRRRGRVWFYLPVCERATLLDGVRAVIRSSALARQAALAIGNGADVSEGAMTRFGGVGRDYKWLFEHGVTRIVLFDREKSDNANAPELFASIGRLTSTLRIPSIEHMPRKVRSDIGSGASPVRAGTVPSVI